MAVTHGGTNANNSLSSLTFQKNDALADIATIAQAILNDQLGLNNGTPAQIWPGAWSQSGTLFVPNRGVLKVFEGDVVMVDPTSGWPILVSKLALSIGGSVWHNA